MLVTVAIWSFMYLFYQQKYDLRCQFSSRSDQCDSFYVKQCIKITRNNCPGGSKCNARLKGIMANCQLIKSCPTWLNLLDCQHVGQSLTPVQVWTVFPVSLHLMSWHLQFTQNDRVKITVQKCNWCIICKKYWPCILVGERVRVYCIDFHGFMATDVN